MNEAPSLPSPYGDGPIPVYRHLKLSAFWFATNFLWGAILFIMLPAEVKHMAPHIRVFAISFITAVSSLIAVIVPLIAGALSDRCSHPLGRRRPFIIWGVGINLVGLLMMSLAYRNAGVLSTNLGHEPGFKEAIATIFTSGGFLFFTLAYMVVQFGNNISSAAYMGFIPDLVPQNQRGAASGYMAIMSQVGTLAGVIVSGVILNHYSETVKYLVISTVLGGVGLMTVMGVQEARLPVQSEKIRWGEYAKLLWIDPRKHTDFAWVWITRFLVMLGFYSVLPFLNYYLIDIIGIEKPEIYGSELIAAILIFSSVSGFYGGVLSDRVGRKKVVMIANMTMAVIGLGFLFCHHFYEVLVVGIIFGIGYGAYISVDWALGTDVLPSKDDAAKEMAVWHISMTLPQTIAAPVAGALIESFGKTSFYKGDEQIIHYTWLGYSAVFVMAAICFVAAAFFLKNVRGVR